MPDHHPMASDSIEPSLCLSIDEDPRLRSRAGRIWSRAPDGLVVPVLIVLLPVWLPLALLDQGRRWFLQQFLLGYLGGRPKPVWGYPVLSPITPRRSIRDGEKVLRVLHWAFQQRGQEWASCAMVRDASSGRLRRGLTEVMAMLEDGGELQVQCFTTNETLGDLAAPTIPHGARQHGLLRAIELYLEFRDEASRIRRFDFKRPLPTAPACSLWRSTMPSGNILTYTWRSKQPPLSVRQRGGTMFRGLRSTCAKANQPPGACQRHAVAYSVSSRSSSPC